MALSRDERQHLERLRQWVVTVKAGPEPPEPYRTLMARLLALMPESQRRMHDLVGNVEWLIAIIERETHRAGVRAMLGRPQR